MRKSPILIVLSLISLIVSTAMFTATNDMAFLNMMIVSAIGGFAGLVIASGEDADERAELEFKQRLADRRNSTNS